MTLLSERMFDGILDTGERDVRLFWVRFSHKSWEFRRNDLSHVET
jgi:hypothetical protein